MSERRAKCLRVAWRFVALCCLLATIGFIWSNSMRNATQSTAQSGFWRDLFRQIFDIEQQPFRFLYENLRKVAHFFEFALLGAEAAWLLLGRRHRLARLALGFGICLLVAMADEAIQWFVPGRVAALLDVLLDGAGSLCGLLLYSAAAAAVCRLFKKK